MSFQSFYPIRLSFCLILMGLSMLPVAEAAELTWDAETGTSGVQDGSGTWVVGGTNWYSESANVPWALNSTDIAVFGAGGTLTSGTRVVTVNGTVSAGGLKFNPLAASSEAYTLQGGTINIVNGGAIEIVDGATAANAIQRIQLGSNVTGSNLSIIKSGTAGTTLGSIQLRNAKNWTGTLTLRDQTTTPAESLFVEVYNGSALNTLSAVDINTNSTLAVVTTDTLSTNFLINSLAGRGALRLDVDNTRFTGTITTNVASTVSVNTSGHTARFSGVLNGAASLNFGTVGKAGTYIIDGVLAGTGGITVNEGTVVLAGANTTTGSITMNKGEVIIANSAAMNTVAPISVNFVGTAAKTFTLNGFNTTVGSLIGSGTSINVQNASATAATLTITGSGTSFGGLINDGTGGGALSLEYRGPATSSRYGLSGNNTFTGNVTITQGTLIARNNNALGLGSLVTVAQAGKLELDTGVTISGKHLITSSLVGAAGSNTWNGTVQVASGGTNATFEASTGNTLTITGQVNGTNTAGQLSDITADGAGTVVIQGNIVNARRLVKNGTGTLVLGGSNSFNSSSAGTNNFGLSLQSGTVRLTNANALGDIIPGRYNMVTFHSNASSKILQVFGVNAYAKSLFSGATATNSIVENGSTTNGTLILMNPDNRSFNGVIRDGGTGTLGLTIMGTGTQTLYGASTYNGDTTVAGGGTLVLNFNGSDANVTAPTSNILNNDDNQSALVLAGGTLQLTGKASTNNSQQFRQTTITGGSSTIQMSAATSNNLALSLGALTRSSGSIGTVNFVLPTGTQSATNGITTTTANNSTGIIGNWATVNGTDWAANNGSGNIVAFTGYTDVTSNEIKDLPNQHVRIGTGVSGNITLENNTATVNDVYSLLHASTSDVTIIIPGYETPPHTSFATLRVAADGAVMLASNAGALTIGVTDSLGGKITAGGTDNTNGVLTFINHSTTKAITVNAEVGDNGTGIVSLVKSGVGELILNNRVNSYTGGTYVLGGTLTVFGDTNGADQALGALPSSFDADNLTFDGGTLKWGSAFNIDSSRGITLLAGGGTFNVGRFTVGSTLINGTNYGGVISGVGGLTKTGAGTLYLNSANTYEGETLVSAGVLAVNNNGALGSTAGATVVALDGRVTLKNGVVVSGETITIIGTGGNGLGSSTTDYGQGNNGALQVAASSSATWRGSVIIGATGARVGGGDNSTLTIDGVIRNGGSSSDQGMLAISTSGNGGIVRLSQNNVYTGDTQLVRGTLQLGVTNALPQGTNLQFSIANSVTELIAFDLAGFNQTIASLLSGATSAEGNQRIINSGTTLSKLTVNQTASTTYQGSIQGNVELEKSGTGTLTLNSALAATSGATNYTGKTTVSGGTLALSGSGDLTGTPWIDVGTGATFDVSARTGGSYTVTNKILTGTGTFKGTYVVSGTSMIRPGTSVTGATIAQAGAGFGTLTFENLTLSPVSAGSDPRVLMQLGGTNSRVTTFTESAIVAAAATSPAGLYDQIVVTGSLTTSAGSAIKVTFANSFVAQFGDVFNLVDWVTGTGFSGGFNVNTDLDLTALDAALGSGLFVNRSLFQTHGIIYVVPEPSKAVLLLAGMAGLLMVRRRRSVGTFRAQSSN